MRIRDLWRRGREERSGYTGEVAAILSALGIESIGDSDDGFLLSRERILEIPAVWCAVYVIASKISEMPLRIYEESRTGRERVLNGLTGQVEALWNRAASPGMTAYRAKMDWLFDALLDGVGYMYIERGQDGVPVNLWPLVAACVNPKPSGRVYQVSRVDGRLPPLAADGMVMQSDMLVLPFHCRHSAGDGGYISPRYRLSRSLGVAWMAQEFARRFFRGGGLPPAFAMLDPGNKGLSDEKRFGILMQRIASLGRRAKKFDSNLLPLPSEVSDIKNIGIDIDKTQMHESRQFAVAEVSRIYNIPPVILHDLSHGTFANAAQQDMHLAKHTLTPWATAIEQECSIKLFSRESGLTCDLDMTAILRGDFLTRSQAGRLATQSGSVTLNEWRRSEGMTPLQDPLADCVWMPVNTAPLQGGEWLGNTVGMGGSDGAIMGDDEREAMNA